MPTEAEKISPARRGFLRGNYFTREGRARLAVDQVEQGQTPPGEVSLEQHSCLGWQRMTCLSCRDVCPENAIVMAANLQPEIRQSRCTSCGKCVPVCPVGAIRISILGMR